ncbi:MAG: hypothetical protein JNK87_06600 [Bryobacterales bacterium]|nr:hypothetical protein [Bryobacterales bacterium]
MTEAMRPYLDKMQTRALIVGVVGLIATAVAGAAHMDQLLRSYLVGFLLWAGVAIGSVGVLMLHHMVGGGWGVAIRRGLEASTRTLPLIAVLFIPIAAGLHGLYEWSHADVVAKDHILQQKALYLNPTGFYIRAVIYFVIWYLLATRLNALSKRQESEGYWAVRPSLQTVSAPGLLLHTLAVTFAAVDWGMSLEPHWFSTIYGVLFLVNQALSVFAVMIFTMTFLGTREPMKGVVSTQTFHDLGTLMFAFNMLWAYMNVSQLIIMWSANLPEEITWYVKRLNGGWGNVATVLFIFHFGVVFFLLKQRGIKRNPGLLRTVAAWVILMRFVDLLWVIMPAFSHGQENGVPVAHFAIHPTDLTAPIAIGGLWVAFFAFQLKKRSLEPLPLN